MIEYVAGVRRPLLVLTSKVEVLQAAHEPHRLLGHHSILPGAISLKFRRHTGENLRAGLGIGSWGGIRPQGHWDWN